jgi:hypothetical protein
MYRQRTVNTKERWGAERLRVKEIERVLLFRLQRRDPALKIIQLQPQRLNICEAFALIAIAL